MKEVTTVESRGYSVCLFVYKRLPFLSNTLYPTKFRNSVNTDTVCYIIGPLCAHDIYRDNFCRERILRASYSLSEGART